MLKLRNLNINFYKVWMLISSCTRYLIVITINLFLICKNFIPILLAIIGKTESTANTTLDQLKLVSFPYLKKLDKKNSTKKAEGIACLKSQKELGLK